MLCAVIVNLPANLTRGIQELEHLLARALEVNRISHHAIQQASAIERSGFRIVACYCQHE